MTPEIFGIQIGKTPAEQVRLREEEQGEARDRRCLRREQEKIKKAVVARETLWQELQPERQYFRKLEQLVRERHGFSLRDYLNYGGHPSLELARIATKEKTGLTFLEIPVFGFWNQGGDSGVVFPDGQTHPVLFGPKENNIRVRRMSLFGKQGQLYDLEEKNIAVPPFYGLSQNNLGLGEWIEAELCRLQIPEVTDFITRSAELELRIEAIKEKGKSLLDSAEVLRRCRTTEGVLPAEDVRRKLVAHAWQQAKRYRLSPYWSENLCPIFVGWAGEDRGDLYFAPLLRRERRKEEALIGHEGFLFRFGDPRYDKKIRGVCRTYGTQQDKWLDGLYSICSTVSEPRLGFIRRFLPGSLNKVALLGDSFLEGDYYPRAVTDLSSTDALRRLKYLDEYEQKMIVLRGSCLENRDVSQLVLANLIS